MAGLPLPVRQPQEPPFNPAAESPFGRAAADMRLRLSLRSRAVMLPPHRCRAATQLLRTAVRPSSSHRGCMQGRPFAVHSYRGARSGAGASPAERSPLRHTRTVRVAGPERTPDASARYAADPGTRAVSPGRSAMARRNDRHRARKPIGSRGLERLRHQPARRFGLSLTPRIATHEAGCATPRAFTRDRHDAQPSAQACAAGGPAAPEAPAPARPRRGA